LFISNRFQKRRAPQPADNGGLTTPTPLEGALMQNLQEATEKICDLKGNVLALETVNDALLQTLRPELQPVFLKNLSAAREACLSQLLGAVVSDSTVAAFERDVQRVITRWSQ
jgi:hypothetical protein